MWMLSFKATNSIVVFLVVGQGLVIITTPNYNININYCLRKSFLIRSYYSFVN